MMNRILTILLTSTLLMAQSKPETTPEQNANGKNPAADASAKSRTLSGRLYAGIDDPEAGAAGTEKVIRVIPLTKLEVEETQDGALVLKGKTEQAPMAASVASVYALVFTNYTGVKELYCPATHPVVDIATCDNGGVPILWDQKTLPMPPGTLPNAKWTNYLLPNKENPTGVRCTQLPAFSAQGRLRCRTN